MTFPPQRWVKVVMITTSVVFLGVAVYLYGFRFCEWIESDAAVTDVLAARIIDAKTPIVTDWYYANGDVWLLGAQLLAIIPVAILGVGTVSLLVTVVLGFVLELVVFTKLYMRLCGELWVAVLATMVTMMAWSSAHVAFGYIQLAYAFLTMLCMLSFVTFATLIDARMRPLRWISAMLLVALIGAQNPTRALAFIVGPLIAGCLWPWQGSRARPRLTIAGVAALGWAVGYVVYAFVFSRNVAFSSPRGHLDFAVVGLSGVGANLGRLGRGLTVLCGGGTEPSLWSIPGVLVNAGAVVFVIREAVTTRALTALRYVCVVVMAQLGIIIVPLLLGNLLVDIPSVRYLMPSLLEALGIGAILAVRAIDEPGRMRKVAMAWLALVPLAAVVAISDVRPPSPERNVWPDSVELDGVAKGIVQRGLTRGYSDILAANLLTLQSEGNALVCPIYVSAPIVPRRWLADTTCFTASALPDRYFIVAYRDDETRAALRATLPRESDVFSVGPTYEVHVYRTSETNLAWLDLPLPDADRSTFPLRIPATHLQLKHGKVALESGRMTATGETGTILYGPYIKLPRGRYTLRWFGNGLPSPGEIKFFVVTGGSEILAQGGSLTAKLPTTPGELIKLTFKLEQARDSMEFSVYSQDGGRAAFDELVIERR